MRKALLTIAVLSCGSMTMHAQSLTLKRQIVDKLISEGQLTQAKVQELGGTDKVIDVKNVDLNRDGNPEFFVDCVCQVSDAVYVLRKTANQMQIIFWGGQRQMITPLQTYTNGWRD